MTHVLTLNAGSSSLKFALYAQAEEPELLLKGQVDRIGGAADLSLSRSDGTALLDHQPIAAGSDHAAALSGTLAALDQHAGGADIQVVGHRIVHGGPDFGAPVRLTAEVLDQLAQLTPLAPLHQPHNLAGVSAALDAFPEATQVGCFDTGFHRGHPFVNDVFALPRRYYDQGVRRYGFHGLSYDYIASVLERDAPDLYAGRVVVAHLGNGASMCGMRAGRSVASSMGFSALDGLPMGTRCGQLDPGVLLYLMQQEGLSAEEITSLLYRDSGLLGLSGISHDMRTLLASPQKEAAEAIDYYCFRARRELGALSAALEGLDGVVFCGGVGENAAPIRARICAGLAWLGLDLDPEANATNASVISTATSRVRVQVIPTDEERVIARACYSLTKR